MLSIRADDLEQAAAVGDFSVRFHQDHAAVFVGEAEHQYLGHELADLFGGKIDHGGNLFADQFFQSVMHGELGGGLALANLWSEIHIQFVGWIARLRVGFGPQNGADADINAIKGVVDDFEALHSTHLKLRGRISQKTMPIFWKKGSIFVIRAGERG